MVRPVDPFINPMDDYLAEAERREQAIPDVMCLHGDRLRHCGWIVCVKHRAKLLERDAKRRGL